MHNLIHVHNTSAEPFSVQWDGKKYTFAGGETKSIEEFLYWHATKLPDCPLKPVDPNLGPAQFAKSEAELAIAARKKLEDEQRALNDRIEKAKLDEKAKVAAAKAMMKEEEKK